MTFPGSEEITTGAVPVFNTASGESIKPSVAARRQSRRQFIQLASAVGAGIGLACLDVLSNPFVKMAHAAPYEFWEDCHGYFSETTICVPSTSYFGSDNCDFYYYAHFHRAGVTYGNDGQGHNYRCEYEHNGSSCGGRNAWIWRGRVGNKMCSDGRKRRYIEYDGSGGWRLEFNSFSICGTAP
jgi:hypothetical protein